VLALPLCWQAAVARNALFTSSGSFIPYTPAMPSMCLSYEARLLKAPLTPPLVAFGAAKGG